MAKPDRCPLCGVSVKEENLVRHLNSNHPRHPDALRLKETLKREGGGTAGKTSAPPFRLSRLHMAVIALVAILGLTAYYVSPYFQAPPGTFPCVTGSLVYHWHTQLTITVAGNPYTIPADIGLTATCSEPLHTHDTSGLIHIETNVGRLYTLGDFFTVWGKSFANPLQMTVNGTAMAPTSHVTLWDLESIDLSYASF